MDESDLPQVRLIIFCKAPIPGSVKTRLIPAVGAGSAANIHARLATETIGDGLQLARENPRILLELWCAPDTHHAFFHSFARPQDINLFTQEGADLGERMANALTTEAGPALLIGTDCPPVDASYLRDAIKALEDHPMILSPAEDGGYGLIGMQRPESGVFQHIDWSTSKVCEQTLQRCQDLNIHPHLLPTIWDVDEAADLDRWLAGRSDHP